MSLLGVDYGTKRLGVAVAKEEGRYVFPRDTVDGTEPERGLAEIAALAREEAAEAIVLGLPLNADGSAGPMAERARRFGARLVLLTGRPVHLVDERYSSQEAEERLRDRYPKDTRKRRRLRDRGAAVIILRTFLEHGALERVDAEGAERLLATPEKGKSDPGAEKPSTG